MGLPLPLPPPIFTIFVFYGFLLATHVATSSDYATLVYKGCADQKFNDPTASYAQNLKSLYSSLVSQSSAKSYSSATVGDGGYAITGMFQCRGDLTDSQCGACVSKIPDMAGKLCSNAIAARVQLTGCCLQYAVAGFRIAPDTQLLYKVCGSSRASGFGERRNAAMEMAEAGVGKGGLFYAGTYQNVYVLGQCEGDLGSGGGDCGRCVKAAAETAKSECGEAISGQVYLQKCYISYRYYPNGVPSLPSPLPSSTGSGFVGGHNTQKTVAVVVGGVAALGFGIVCLLFVRSVLKKRSSVFHD